MSTYRGAYSGSGKSPLANDNCLEDAKQDTGAQKGPSGPDYSGGRAKGKPVDADLAFSGGNSGYQGGKSEGEKGNT